MEADRREAQVRQRYPGLRRERSLQDIDKDIETIWRELQELDKLPLDRPSSTAPLPLSEQHLVSPREGSHCTGFSCHKEKAGQTRKIHVLETYFPVGAKIIRASLHS